MKYDYVIIGGGVSGVIAAIIQARLGYKVLLVEKSSRIMPVVRGFSRKGVHFDTGLHYTGCIGPGECLDMFFNFMGIRHLLKVVPMDKGGFDRLYFPDGWENFNYSYEKGETVRRLVDRFPHEEKAITTYYEKVNRLFSSSPWLNYQDEIQDGDDFFNIKEQSLAQTLDGLTKDERLKTVLLAHCMLHGVAPSKVPFHVHGFVCGSFEQTVGTFQDGGLALAKAFEAGLNDSGVSVVTGSGVDSIQVDSSGKVKGVLLENGIAYEAKASICTVHPRLMLDMVPDGLFRPAFKKRINYLDETPSVNMLFGICREDVPELGGCNAYHIPTHGVEHSFSPDSMMQERIMYVAGTQGSSRRKKSLVVISPTPNLKHLPHKFNQVDHKQKKQLTAKQLEKYFRVNFPEFEDKVYFVDSSVPQTMSKWGNTPYGSVYGAAHTVEHFSPLPVTKLKGLFLAGQAVVAPGILGAMVSSFLTCGLIEGRENLRQEILKCN